MDVSPWEVWRGLWQRYRGHVMCLELIPVRNVVEQGRLQLYEDLAQEFTLLLLDSRLVPHCDLQHALSEVSPMNVGINKGLVPLGLSALFHCFSPSFTLITPIRQEVHLDVGVSRSSVWSGWQVYGLKDVDNQLMAHFVVPQLHRELSRQNQRNVSESAGTSRGHHRYRWTVHLLGLKGAGACRF